MTVTTLGHFSTYAHTHVGRSTFTHRHSIAFSRVRMSTGLFFSRRATEVEGRRRNEKRKKRRRRSIAFSVHSHPTSFLSEWHGKDYHERRNAQMDVNMFCVCVCVEIQTLNNDVVFSASFLLYVTIAAALRPFSSGSRTLGNYRQIELLFHQSSFLSPSLSRADVRVTDVLVSRQQPWTVWCEYAFFLFLSMFRLALLWNDRCD